MSEWRTGDVVEGLYEVKEVLRTGGMGTVYRVHHREWAIDLAVKSPRADLLASSVGLRNFVTEAETWVGLGLHPNTVSCVYVRTIRDVPRVFAEWVDGGDLAAAVRSGALYGGGPRTALARILDVAIQFAWGLGHAHDQKLVHQDIKPANVMLTSDGTVKVTDFGLAKARASTEALASAPVEASVLATYRGMTPAYCSPEQAAAAGGAATALTPATDVWSWALSVLEMFVGAPPTRFGQAGADVLRAFVESGASTDPPIPAMPRSLAALLGRCFAADPGARPARMLEVADELIALYDEVLGEPFGRPRPEAARLLADGLSNQALSLLDLGRPAEADALWAKALATDPAHLHSVHNRGLHRWRAGVAGDLDVVAALEVASTADTTALGAYLIGTVHLERGDAAAAAASLAEALHREPGSRDARHRLDRARCMRNTVDLLGHTGAVRAVALADPAGLAVTGGADGTVKVWDISTGRCLHTLVHAARGHDGVAAVAVTPDGRLAASAAYDGTIRTWHLPAGAPGMRFRAHGTSVRGIAVRADGTLLLSASDDGSVRLWSAGDGALLRTLEEGRQHGAIWRSGQVAFGAAGLALAAGGRDVTPFGPTTADAGKVWDVATGELLAVAPGGATGLSVSIDGHTVLSHGPAGMMTVWDPRTREVSRQIRCAGAGDLAAISSDGSTAVTDARPDRSVVVVWALPRGQRVRTIAGHAHGVNAVAISADGNVALSGAEDGTARVWQLPAERVLAPWSYARPSTTTEINAAAAAARAAKSTITGLLEAGRFVDAVRELRAARSLPGHNRDPELLAAWWQASGAGRRTDVLAAWRLVTLGARAVPEGQARMRTPIALADDPLKVFAGLDDGTIAMSEPMSRRSTTVFGRIGPAIAGLSATPDGRTLIAGDRDGTVTVWDTAIGTSRRLGGTGRPGVAGLLAISDDGGTGICADTNGVLRVWDLQTGRFRRQLKVAGGFVQALAMDAAGTVVVTCGVDAPVAVWDLARPTERPARILDGHRKFVRAVAVSADGRFAVTGCDDRTVRVWDLRTGSRLHVLAGHTAEVFSIRIQNDVVLSAGPDANVRVWDRVSGRCRHVLAGHSDTVDALDVAPDGRFALSGSADRSMRVWNLESGLCLQTLGGHLGRVDRVAFSNDARFALACSSAGQAVVWELDWDVALDGNAHAADMKDRRRRSPFARLFRRDQ